MINITAAAQTTVVDRAIGLLITVNAALTGTLTVKDGSTTVATITNPTVGNSFRYYGFNSTVSITPSTTCDITASVLNRQE